MFSDSASSLSAQSGFTECDEGAPGSASRQRVCSERTAEVRFSFQLSFLGNSSLKARIPQTDNISAFYVRYGSLKRRSLMSPKAWKASFSEYHKNYNPRTVERHSFRSPDKPRSGTLSRESSLLGVSSRSSPEKALSESRELDAESCHSEKQNSEDLATGKPENDLEPGEAESQAKDEKDLKESDQKEEPKKDPPSESSSELNNSCDSESLELQLSAADNGQLHIEEEDESPVTSDPPKPNRLENGAVSSSDTGDLSIPQKVCFPNKPPLRLVITPLFQMCVSFFFRVLLQKNKTQKAQTYKVFSFINTYIYET